MKKQQHSINTTTRHRQTFGTRQLFYLCKKTNQTEIRRQMFTHLLRKY